MGLRYDQHERVVTITLDRPEALNAIDPEMHRDLIDAWTRFRDDPEAWVAILTGAGEKAFSAGADLKKLIPQAFGSQGAGRSHNDLGLGGITRGLGDLEARHRGGERVCARRGLGARAVLRPRVAAEHAVFGLTEVRWAIMPGAGGTQRLPRAVPLAKAMEMILMGETLSAQEAHRIGLVNAVVPAAEVLPTARRWAQTLCERGPLAVRAAKEAIVRGLSLPLADGLRLEAFLSGTLRGTEDAAEGPKAFAEKRKPVFRAR